MTTPSLPPRYTKSPNIITMPDQTNQQMAEWKQKEAALDAEPSETLPAYSLEDDAHSVAVGSSASTAASTSVPVSSTSATTGSIVESKVAAERARNNPSNSGPTADAPFNFPSDATLPPYSPVDNPAGSTSGGSSHNDSIRLPLVIPQVRPRPDSPFLSAYSQDLLRYGIPKDTWLSFTDTLSAFLTANISEKALSHAADIGRQISNVPADLGRSIGKDFSSVGRGIANSAKKGNIFGVATGFVGGMIGLSVGTGLKLAASATMLPGKAAMAVASTPQTPRERAAAYALVANGEWLGQRNLKAQIMDSVQVAELLSIPLQRLLQDSQAAHDGSAAEDAPLRHLHGAVAGLEIPAEEAAPLSPTVSGSSSKVNLAAARNSSKTLEEIGQATLWLVVTQEKHKGFEKTGEAGHSDDDQELGFDRRASRDRRARGNRTERRFGDQRRPRGSMDKGQV